MYTYCIRVEGKILNDYQIIGTAYKQTYCEVYVKVLNLNYENYNMCYQTKNYKIY